MQEKSYPLTSARWQQVQALFFQSLEIVEDEREAWLTQRCSAEPGLAPMVLGMLRADAKICALQQAEAAQAEPATNHTPRSNTTPCDTATRYAVPPNAQPIGISTMQITLSGAPPLKHIESAFGDNEVRHVRDKIALALIYEATNRKPAASEALNEALENLASMTSQTPPR